jgi:hypothetical protein
MESGRLETQAGVGAYIGQTAAMGRKGWQASMDKENIVSKG